MSFQFELARGVHLAVDIRGDLVRRTFKLSDLCLAVHYLRNLIVNGYSQSSPLFALIPPMIGKTIPIIMTAKIFRNTIIHNISMILAMADIFKTINQLP